jgi:hypothetical protein
VVNSLDGAKAAFQAAWERPEERTRYAQPKPFRSLEPDVRISRIRLSDWVHLKAHDGR